MSSPSFQRKGTPRVLPTRPVLVDLTVDAPGRSRDDGPFRAQPQDPVHPLGLSSSNNPARGGELARGAQVFVAYRTIVRCLVIVSALTVLIGQAIGRDIVPPAIALAGVALAEVVCSLAASRAVARFAALGSILGRGGDPLPWRLK